MLRIGYFNELRLMSMLSSQHVYFASIIPTRHGRNMSSAEKYGYVLNEETGFLEKDKSTNGILHVGISKIPQALKDSLLMFYKNKSRKQMISDGMQLSKHLKNRGRPTHYTWSKYKQQIKGKKEERLEVRTFSVDEAIQEGLVQPVAQNDVDDTSINNESVSEKDKSQKRPKLSEYSMIRYGKRETNAYIASQIPSVYGATYRALSEIEKRIPNYQPRTLLDFGSGCGMTVWSANSIWGKSIKEYQCVDASEHMNDAAEFLLRGSKDINVPLKIPNVYFKRFLPLSNQIMYDIVVSAYSLTEMPFRSQRLQAIKSLWRKTNDFLVIIEPGNNEGFDTTLCAREFIINHCNEESSVDYEQSSDDPFDDFNVAHDIEFAAEDEGHIFAPCPHEHMCARTFVETRDQPCNFNQKVELSLAQLNSNLKRYGYHDERFSYIILRKGKENALNDHSKVKEGWTRVLKPVKARKGHVICELCCSNGNIEKHIVTKTKDPQIYKAARHRLKSGDMLPISEMKRPMNIRKPIPPSETKQKLKE